MPTIYIMKKKNKCKSQAEEFQENLTHTLLLGIKFSPIHHMKYINSNTKWFNLH